MIIGVIEKTRPLRVGVVTSMARVLCPTIYDRQLKQYPRPVVEFLKTQGKTGLVGLEVGVAFGIHALNILEKLPIKKLYLVDPYIEYEDNVKQEKVVITEYNKGKAHAKNLLQKYKDTMHLRKNWGNIDIYAVIEHILKLLEYGQAYASKDVTDIEYWDKQFEKTTSDASKNAVEELELKKASD